MELKENKFGFLSFCFSFAAVILAFFMNYCKAGFLRVNPCPWFDDFAPLNNLAFFYLIALVAGITAFVSFKKKEKPLFRNASMIILALALLLSLGKLMMNID
ncbi:MAG: hypothetical protein QXK06_03405 [Candidatus Diapherotrites archaeon]